MTTSILFQEVLQKRVASLCRLCRGRVKTSQGYCTIKSVRDYLIDIYIIYLTMTYQMTNQRYIQPLFVPHVKENWNITKKVKKQPKSDLTMNQIVFV